MAKVQYYKSQAAADRALTVIFGDTDKDVVTRDEATNDRKKLSTFVMALREFGYGDANKAKDGSTESVFINQAGRTRLQEIKGSQATILPPLTSSPTPVSEWGPTATAAALEPREVSAPRVLQVTPETVLRDIRELQRQMPSFNIVFKIEPKDWPM